MDQWETICIFEINNKMPPKVSCLGTLMMNTHIIHKNAVYIASLNANVWQDKRVEPFSPQLLPEHMPFRMICPPFPPSPPSGPPNSLRGSLWKQLMPEPPFPPRNSTLRWSTKCLFYKEQKVPEDVSNTEALPGDSYTLAPTWYMLLYQHQTLTSELSKSHRWDSALTAHLHLRADVNHFRHNRWLVWYAYFKTECSNSNLESTACLGNVPWTKCPSSFFQTKLPC